MSTCKSSTGRDCDVHLRRFPLAEHLCLKFNLRLRVRGHYGRIIQTRVLQLGPIGALELREALLQ